MKKFNDRENNYDLLRILACFAVIVAHVSAQYIDNITLLGTFYSNGELRIIILFNVLSRFAVSSFVMLSGAFLLSNYKNKDRKTFYKKSIKTIVIPTLIFSVFYFLIAEAKVLLGVIKYGNNLNDILIPIRNFLIGLPYYHMWYMYMLIGLYLIIPDLICYVEKIEKKEKNIYYYIAIVLMCLYSGLTTIITIRYSICNVMVYSGYLFLGYKIRKSLNNKKNNKVGSLLILSGFIILALLSIYAYNNYMLVYKVQYKLLSTSNLVFSITNFGPFICLASSLIFAGFSKMNIKRDFTRISNKTFLIFLFHAIVISIIYIFEDDILKIKPDIFLIMIINSILSFIISYILSCAYLWLYKKIDVNDCFEKIVIKKLHLD
ncbi:MAG: acyltransferase [Bacilli bacterium]|nr:acyltransferase [Bacilli bacterium]